MPFFPTGLPINISNPFGSTIPRNRINITSDPDGGYTQETETVIDRVEPGQGIPIEVVPPDTGNSLYFGLRVVEGMEEMNNDFPFYASSDIEFFLERADVQSKPERDDRTEGQPSKESDRPIPSAKDGNWQIGKPNEALKSAVDKFDPGKPVDLTPGFTGSTSELPTDTFNPGAGIPAQWRFVAAPMEVSWTRSGDLSTSEAYATNEPFVIYSQTSLRQLTLGDALVEGFTLGKTVDKVLERLEAMMRIVINPNGFASPFVWRVVADSRDYGLFIIKDLDIKEELRDRNGRSTRARVSISLIGVPEYQVDNGRDLARKEDLVSVSAETAKLLEAQNSKDGVSPTADGTSNGTPGVSSGGKVLSSTTGTASFYNVTGNRTANGEVYTGRDLTAASNTLPFGTLVRVTRTDNGKSVTVRINDNGGPTVTGNVDLSPAAFQKIANPSEGRVPVRMDVIRLGTQRNPNQK